MVKQMMDIVFMMIAIIIFASLLVFLRKRIVDKDIINQCKYLTNESTKGSIISSKCYIGLPNYLFFM